MWRLRHFTKNNVRRFLEICLHLLKKSLTKKFLFVHVREASSPFLIFNFCINLLYSIWVIIGSLVRWKLLYKRWLTWDPDNISFEETIGFSVKASFARRPVSRPIKPGEITKEFQEKTIQFHGTFYGLKSTNSNL